MRKNIELKSKPMNKKNNSRKLKKKILRVLVYIVLIMFVLSLLFLIGYGIYYFGTSSRYFVSKVQFKNNNIYDVQTLTETAQVPMGVNIYKISKKDISTRLEQLPYVEHVNIKKVLPDSIQIQIKEYTSRYFAYNEETDRYVRLTSNGVILEQVEGEVRTDDELLVFGLNFDDNLKAKSVIVKTELEKIQLYEKVSGVYKKSQIDKQITNIEFKDGNIILTLDHDINVILNDEDLDYDINFLKSILDKVEGKSGTIDMTKENPVFTESIR